MSPQPLVTVGVPVYNGERFLRQCIDSLLNQTFRDFRLVVSDNASTDRTREIAESYVAADSRVTYRRHAKNIGMYGNFDSLLRTAETKYVKLANADDYWSREMLGDALQQLESDSSVVLCYPLMTMIDAEGKIIERYGYRLHLLEDDPVIRFRRVLTEIRLVNQLMGVMRNDAARRLLPLLEHTLGDRILVAELSLHGKIFQVDKYQYFRRFHEHSSSFSRGSDAHQIAHVYSEGTRSIGFKSWKYHHALMRRVGHSGLEIAKKADLLAFLLRGALWDRHALLGDLVAGIRHGTGQ
jgi:glycosyltransferase involved in cell wall biosynthesis